MLTIRLPYQTSQENIQVIADLQRQQSSLTRFIYARLEEGLSRKEIATQAQGMFQLDSWFIQSSYIKAKALFQANVDKNHKHIWGGRKNFFLRSSGKLSSQEYKARRLLKLHLEGEAPQRGNRKFELKLASPEGNFIVFKPQAGQKLELRLPDQIHKNYLSKLLTLQELAQDRQMPYTVELDQDYIYLIFQLDEASRLKSINKRSTTKTEVRQSAKEKLESLTQQSAHNSSQVMGLDLNPNWIGISVLEFDQDDNFKVIHKEAFDMSSLNGKANFDNDKKRHETIEAAKYIVNLAEHFNCAKLSIEELKIKLSNKGLGRNFNRLCNNVWHRNLLEAQLSKRCQENQIELVKVNAAYSSTIGNLLYGNASTPDMIASSIEVARRGFKKYTKNWFYPAIPSNEDLRNQWKEDSSQMKWSSWPELHTQIKNSGLRYRVPLELANAKVVCRHKSKQSGMKRIEFAA